MLLVNIIYKTTAWLNGSKECNNYKNMEDKYKRIACSVYDRYEGISSLNQRIDIVFLGSTDEQLVRKDILIEDLYTKSKIEYMKLEDQTVIRLDKIISVHEVP